MEHNTGISVFYYYHEFLYIYVILVSVMFYAVFNTNLTQLSEYLRRNEIIMRVF